jgi:tetratricopeptide (TPR) repeat protein
MKNLFFLLLFVLLHTPKTLQAQDAHALYEQGKFDSSAHVFLSPLQEGEMSAVLFYNAGTAFAQAGDFANASLYLEKAAKLNPADQHIRNNILYLRKRNIDRVDTDRGGLEGWLYGIINGRSVNFWTWVCVLLCNGAFGLFILARFSSRSKLWMASGFLLLTFSLCTGMAAWYGKQSILNEDFAVIFEPEAQILSAPAENGQLLFTLHAGTKVRVIDENETWLEIALDESNSGWVQKNKLKKI